MKKNTEGYANLAKTKKLEPVGECGPTGGRLTTTRRSCEQRRTMGNYDLDESLFRSPLLSPARSLHLLQVRADLSIHDRGSGWTTRESLAVLLGQFSRIAPLMPPRAVTLEGALESHDTG